MAYDLSRLPLRTLIAPVATAAAALARVDERIAVSPAGPGFADRAHFADACASLFLDGELVSLEDLVLHDAAMGVRAPTHELTVAHDVLRTRRRILGHPPGWALSPAGLHSLRGGAGEDAPARDMAAPPAQEPAREDGDDPLARHLAAVDAVLARSEALLAAAAGPSPAPPRERDPLLYEPDWDEDERLGEWRAAVDGTEGLPAVLRAALGLDAWNELQVLQHAPWLGRLLAAALLRETGATTAHLAAINLGLKTVRHERRRSRDRTIRLVAILDGLAAAAEAGLKEHDRLQLARQRMERLLAGRRRSSKLPQLIDLVLSRPMVSANMIAEALSVTPRGALKIASELNLRELTGRERFRAWGVI